MPRHWQGRAQIKSSCHSTRRFICIGLYLSSLYSPELHLHQPRHAHAALVPFLNLGMKHMPMLTGDRGRVPCWIIYPTCSNLPAFLRHQSYQRRKPLRSTCVRCRPRLIQNMWRTQREDTTRVPWLLHRPKYRTMLEVLKHPDFNKVKFHRALGRDVRIARRIMLLARHVALCSADSVMLAD